MKDSICVGVAEDQCRRPGLQREREHRPALRRGSCRSSTGCRPHLGDRLRRRRQRRRHPGADQSCECRDEPADRRGLVQPQLRQGDRHRGRPRPCARRSRRDHGRRPAASAGDDRDLRAALARRLRSWSTASAPTARGETRSSAASRAPFYRLFDRFGEIAAAGGRRRFPPHRPQGRRGAAHARRAGPLLQGPLRLDRLQERSACRSSSASASTGSSKWSFRKLFRFAFDGITSFSTVPLRVWTYLGALISLAVDRDRHLLR